MFGGSKSHGADEVKKRIKKLKVKLGLIPKENLDEDKF